jgi:hypothetical protein
MKKHLGIIVLGLLLSGNAFAEKLIHLCDLKNYPGSYDYHTKTIDTKNQIVIEKWKWNEQGALNSEKAYNFKPSLKPGHMEYRIFEIDNDKVIYGRTNLEWWKYRYENTNQKKYNINNPKRLKKLIKKEGPANAEQKKVTWYYSKEGEESIGIYMYKKKVYGPSPSGSICYSEKYAKIKNQKDNEQKIIKASNQMKQEIEPFKAMCRNIGYLDGTEKFADCVKDLYLKKLDAEQSQVTTSTITSSQPKRRIDPSVWDDLLGVSQGLLGGKSSNTSSRSLSCFKINERVSGTNKICSYNCMGSEVTRNIRSTQICPISIKN